MGPPTAVSGRNSGGAGGGAHRGCLAAAEMLACQQGYSQLSSSEHFHFKGNPPPPSKHFQEKL